jgi:hypothetical protein
MTPTLLGRWQIRVFLLATVGLVISLIVSLLTNKSTVPLFALLYVLLFGLVWDIIYQVITSFRWDRDWPTSFQVAAGIFEGTVLWIVILTGKLPGIPVPPPFYIFLIQYGIIWLSIFLLTQGPLRIFSVHWRYQGGQWFMSHPQRPEDEVPQSYAAPALQGASGNFLPASPQAASGDFQPVPQQRASGAFQQQASGRFQLIQPQVAGGGFQPVPQQAVSGGFQPVQSQPVHPSNPGLQQSPARLAAFQAAQPVPPAQPAQFAQPYVCACGVTSDRLVGKYCPGCGSPKV